MDDVGGKIHWHGDERVIIEELLGLVDGIRAELYDDQVEAAVCDLELLRKKVVALMHDHQNGERKVEGEPARILNLKDEIVTRWKRLPAEHQATMLLILMDDSEWAAWSVEAWELLQAREGGERS